MLSTIMFAVGLIIGLAVGIGLGWIRMKDMKSMMATRDAERQAEHDKIMANMRETFGNLSLEALSKNTETFFKMAQEKFGEQSHANSKEMGAKKELIDQTLKVMKGELDKVQNMMQTIEKDRKAKFDVLDKQLTEAANQTKALQETTSSLNAALTNSRVRGQWGERMAEDVLRLVGLSEGTNYLKQSAISGESGRPDYTFYLPDNRTVHMDVKFPLENYMNYLNADNEHQKEKHLSAFKKDARDRVKEVTKRAYVNDETLDYVLVFIPNEQLYAFINEHDRTLLDEAMKQKVIMCSPTTLYAVLAVIRQAVENFHMEQKAGEVINILSTFQKQWNKFTESLETLGKRLDSAQNAFIDITTTRKRMLEKPLQDIDKIRSEGKFVTGGNTPLTLIENAQDHLDDIPAVSEDKN